MIYDHVSLNCHLQEVLCVKECLYHGAADLKPPTAMLEIPGLACAFLDDGHKPLIQFSVWHQMLQGLDDVKRKVLNSIDLDAVVVEPVDSIFVGPLSVHFVEQVLKVYQCRFKPNQEHIGKLNPLFK
jgi:hypothetical protein